MEGLGVPLRVPESLTSSNIVWEMGTHTGTTFFSLIQDRVATECRGSIKHRTLIKKRCLGISAPGTLFPQNRA